MANQIKMDGCSPIPIASYLKALGILRLLSIKTNSVTGKAADAQVRGWWKGMRFYLQTCLTSHDILEFFLHQYSPSPVIAPWNGGSGFYLKDKKDGIRPLELAEVHPRFQGYSESVNIAKDVLKNLDIKEKPKEAVKLRLVEKLRAKLPMSAIPWLDASIVLSGEKLRFPPVLGTGGNDGRLDFTNNLMQRLFSEKDGLFRASEGTPSFSTAQLLENSLYNTPALSLSTAKVGQFSPSSAGGPNSGTGFGGETIINSWDYVFMLEGALTFASVASRRHQSNVHSGASFPFTVRTSSAGWGGIGATDEQDSRAEFWAPLWTSPARYTEIKALFGEGRAVTKGQMAKDGFDFARAISTLGLSRGFSEFQRYGYFKRAGKSYYAVAIGRRVAEPSPGAKLTSDLDCGGWLQRVRSFARQKDQPASIRHSVKNLEEALFELLAPEPSNSEVTAAIVAVGRLGLRLTRVQTNEKNPVPPPPPLLSGQWIKCADDQSPEFRIAAALAGLGIRQQYLDDKSGNRDAPEIGEYTPPMAAHLVRLTNPRGNSREFETGTFFRGLKLRKSRQWAQGMYSPTVVWGHGGLVSNMIAVLERRLVEAPIRGLSDKPFGSACQARMSDISAFLRGDFNYDRCNDLLTGLIWAKPMNLPFSYDHHTDGEPIVPFVYAALKPIFVTNQILIRLGVIPRDVSIPTPRGLVSRLRTGGNQLDGSTINESVRTAFERMRFSGMPSPFDMIESGFGTHTLKCCSFGVGIRPDRLAASLLIPVFDQGLKALLLRAYPDSLTNT